MRTNRTTEVLGDGPSGGGLSQDPLSRARAVVEQLSETRIRRRSAARWAGITRGSVTLWQFASILLVALLTGLAFAHVLERPAKLSYPGPFYATLQRTLYLEWGPPQVGGFLEPVAILAVAGLAVAVRRRRRAFWWTILALAALLLAFPVVYFWLVAPTNAAFRGPIGQPLPAHWSELRNRWELGHTLRFGFQLLGLASLIASALWRTEGRPSA